RRARRARARAPLEGERGGRPGTPRSARPAPRDQREHRGVGARATASERARVAPEGLPCLPLRAEGGARRVLRAARGRGGGRPLRARRRRAPRRLRRRRRGCERTGARPTRGADRQQAREDRVVTLETAVVFLAAFCMMALAASAAVGAAVALGDRRLAHVAPAAQSRLLLVAALAPAGVVSSVVVALIVDATVLGCRVHLCLHPHGAG